MSLPRPKAASVKLSIPVHNNGVACLKILSTGAAAVHGSWPLIFSLEETGASMPVARGVVFGAAVFVS
jgi:hypothetical protein